MNEAIFFSGCGTAYTLSNNTKRNLEIYPETLPALRFLEKKGYLPVLVTADFTEYKLLQSVLKDNTIRLEYWSGSEDELDDLLEKWSINIEKSYFLTDGVNLQELQPLGWKTILVLTGNGVNTLNSMDVRQLEKILDICKDIYAAAISVVMNK
jgi:histidinol phosphatase-like enzyme